MCEVGGLQQTKTPWYMVDTISKWPGGGGHTPQGQGLRTPKDVQGHVHPHHPGPFLDGTGPEERGATQATIPDLVVDLRALPEFLQDMAMGDLTGGRHTTDADAKTLAPGPQYAQPGTLAEARQEEVAGEYLQRAEEFDRKPGTPEGVKGPMTKNTKFYVSIVPVPAIGAFSEMPLDVGALADVTAQALAAEHTQFFSTNAVEAKGAYKKRIRAGWGHAAHRRWARLLPDCHRDLIMDPGTPQRRWKIRRRGAAAAQRPPLPLPWPVPSSRLRLRHAPETPASCHAA